MEKIIIAIDDNEMLDHALLNGPTLVKNNWDWDVQSEAIVNLYLNELN